MAFSASRAVLRFCGVLKVPHVRNPQNIYLPRQLGTGTMTVLRFDGKVAVVTGAGAGLGRAYALLLASRGAKVVVNDLGGDRHGGAGTQKPADVVVEEIKKAGGTAVADYNSVVEGEKIIKTALDTFGKIDIVINNAGVLRDKSFPRISDQDWDIIHDVHLKGSFKTAQAAFPILKKQGYGRIIMTASNSGVYGNFGQANYSAAKMGLIGLTNTIAIEGAKNNVHCNVIVPTAASRLTEDVLPPDLFEELKPELIAPVVAYLCHDSCQENGAVIDAAAGWAGKIHIVRSNGALLRKSIADGVTIENVDQHWEKVADMTGAKHCSSIQEATGELMTALEQLRTGAPAPAPDSSRDSDIFSFSNKDLIIYALGVGASVGRPEELRFLYENHEDFSGIPTYYIMPGLMTMMTSGTTENAVPGKTITLDQILHGEQYLEIVGNLPQEGKLLSKGRVVEVLDKGSGAAIVNEVESFNEQGELVVRNQSVVFAVGAGKFGGPRTGDKGVPCVPKPERQPDASVSHTTTIDQAALYRLAGDLNPLHIDPNMAVVSGFDRPILHGLCSLGISVRIILGTFAGYDSSLFKAVKARFTKPVLPGQTLRVDMWQEKNRIHFETVVAETNTPVITGAYVDLKSAKMQPIQNNVSTAKLESDAIFEYIIEQIKTQPDKAKSINAVFLYKITKDGKHAKEWTMDLKSACVYEGTPKDCKPNTTITVSDEDFVQLALGKLNPQQAFMKGKLKVAGNIMLAQKLGPLLKAASKLYAAPDD